MKEYDVITIGSGSAMNIVSAMMQSNPRVKVAVVDKDEPGGNLPDKGMHSIEDSALSSGACADY